MSEDDYVLGTRDDEIDRLGVQHRVWRPRMLAAFQRAGIGTGNTVIDVGAGPGFASVDLAEIVGPSGRVYAVERSRHFLDWLAGQARDRDLGWLQPLKKDVVEQPLGLSGADMSWCRWLLCFVEDPGAVVRHIGTALRPGGTAVFHEYCDYASWRMMPPSPLHERFRTQVMASWRDSGGEPDIALWLPALLEGEGFEILSTDVHVDIISASDFAWSWPREFVRTGAGRLNELGYLDDDEARQIATMLDDVPTSARMITPAVAEIIARKL